MDTAPYAAFPLRQPDLTSMTRAELEDYLDTVRDWIARLNEEEPEDMESEAYQAWGDRHEVLEDLADDIVDRLEEL